MPTPEELAKEYHSLRFRLPDDAYAISALLDHMRDRMVELEARVLELELWQQAQMEKGCGD